MKSQLFLAWQLCRKDVQLFLLDRRGALLCFAVPVLLASVFGAVFQRAGPSDAPRLPLLIVAEDDGPLTRRVVAGLLASERLDATAMTRAAALACLAERGGGVAVILPAGFERLTAGVRPRVELLHHPNSWMETTWAEGVFTEVVLREAADALLGPLQAARPEMKIECPFAMERTAVSGPGGLSLNSYSHSFCGMTVQYLLFWGMDSGLLLLRERKQGIWRRIRTTPVTLPAMLGGKVLATALIALCQIAIVFGIGAAAFGVTLTGSAVGFAALAVAAALLSAATGLLVAALGGNEARARSVAILAILTLSMLGGLWLPSFLLPGWVRQIALALPTTWAARGFAGVTWQGMGCAEALRCAAALVGFSVAFLAVALWSFVRAEARLGQPGGFI